MVIRYKKLIFVDTDGGDDTEEKISYQSADDRVEGNGGIISGTAESESGGSVDQQWISPAESYCHAVRAGRYQQRCPDPDDGG